MNDQFNKSNDDYDELLRSFYSNSESEKPKDEVKNRGEIYFSANSTSAGSANSRKNLQRTAPTSRKNTDTVLRIDRPVSSAQNNLYRGTASQASATQNSASGSVAQRPASGVPAAQKAPQKSKTAVKKKKRKKNSFLQNALLSVIIVIFVFISSLIIRIPIMGCINDILAIDVSDTDFRVVLDKDMDVYEVIDELGKKDLINNPMFCKLFAKLMKLGVRTDASGNKKDIVFPEGTYHLNSSMGVEGMLLEIRSNGVVSNTIKVTFPEGFTVNQIAEKLDDSGVCSSEAFYKAMTSEEIFNKYEFLSGITEPQLRYRILEGYLYPDTYEFYIGESPISVIERFLNNFEDKWSSAYAAKANELGYTIDEIITVASILEKEAFDADQMPLIASVLYNRLDSSSFPFINCDSTGKYIAEYKNALTAEGRYDECMKVYDTYQKTGLPIGAICCPGADAIYSALHPENTDFYYFLHDPDGNIYLSRTSEEHQGNLQYLG